MVETVERLKAEVLPAIFSSPARIGSYGAAEGEGDGGKDAMTELSDLLEGSPVSKLSGLMAALVEKLTDADPQKVARQPTWLEKITGKAVETHVRYQIARKQLDELLEEAEGAAQGVRDAVAAIERLAATHESEVARLELLIQAGREFLSENPDAGKPAPGLLEFDNPRERFARKLANLATLVSSHGLSLTQMKLTKASALDMLDRFEETAHVLVPVWRQHTLTLTTTKNMSPAMVAQATKAHEALMKSLGKAAQSASGQGASL